MDIGQLHTVAPLLYVVRATMLPVWIVLARPGLPPLVTTSVRWGFMVSRFCLVGGLALTLVVPELAASRSKTAARPTTLLVERAVMVSCCLFGADERLLAEVQTYAAAEPAYVAAQRGAGRYCGLLAPAATAAALPVMHTLTPGACDADSAVGTPWDERRGGPDVQSK